MESVDSTNTYLARTLAALPGDDARERLRQLGLEPGWQSLQEPNQVGVGAPPVLPLALAIADQQTRCRGRLDRVWYNQSGQSFLASWAVAVPTDLLTGPTAGWLPMAVGMAVAGGLEQTLTACGARNLTGKRFDQALRLKWPNDLFCSGRKLAGVLCEALPVGPQWSVLVAGVGLNLFVPADSLPTAESTSLQYHYWPLSGYESLRNQLAVSVSEHISRELTALAQSGDEAQQAFCDLHERVVERSWTLGKPVEVRPVAGPNLKGTAVQIAADATLLVEDGSGERVSVSTADVGVLPSLPTQGSDMKQT
ncbi:biotin--[acetyl-CoA-carboxylase] ligase [Bombiscardovia apis]|uniref:Biotin--[acetyl-CoA-carboxylase] ligase n=2 Tax=Bombiscardovia apis TaxID=2932182 RepID=A0ABM8BEQ2_9BIFI|nr:biotin--[acetyl-CoA-carboxylase] ligase [Bombiscardovia apis]